MSEEDHWLEVYEALVEEVRLINRLHDDFFKKASIDGKDLKLPSIDSIHHYPYENCAAIKFQGGKTLPLSIRNLRDVYLNADVVLKVHEAMINKAKEEILEHEKGLSNAKEKLLPNVIARRLKK